MACLLGCFVALLSCKQKKQPNTAATTHFEQTLNNNDSTEVVQLVNTFFSYVKANKIESAMDMLYQTPMENEAEKPIAISDSERKKVNTLFTSLPIDKYEIDYIKFLHAYRNEVKCTTILFLGNQSNDIVKSELYFKPVKFENKWYLCLLNSEHGDMGLVDGNKKDSIAKDYSKKQQLKDTK